MAHIGLKLPQVGGLRKRFFRGACARGEARLPGPAEEVQDDLHLGDRERHVCLRARGSTLAPDPILAGVLREREQGTPTRLAWHYHKRV